MELLENLEAGELPEFDNLLNIAKTFKEHPHAALEKLPPEKRIIFPNDPVPLLICGVRGAAEEIDTADDPPDPKSGSMRLPVVTPRCRGMALGRVLWKADRVADGLLKMPITLTVPLDLPDARVLAHQMLKDGTVLIEMKNNLQTTRRCHRCSRAIDQFHRFDRPIQLRRLPVFGHSVIVCDYRKSHRTSFIWRYR